jgi:Glycosyltransferase family 87
MEKPSKYSPTSAVPLVRRALTSYLIAIILLTLIAFAVVSIRRFFLHATYPFNTLLFFPEDRFNDFVNHAQRVTHFPEPDMLTRNDYKVFFNYSAPTLYVFLFFLRVFPNPLYAYLTVAVAAFILAAACFAWSFRDSPLYRWTTALIVVSLVSSFPIWFVLDRANIEGILWMIMLGGTVALVFNRPVLSAGCFAIAASMKIFPAVILLLFLARRQYKALFAAICIAATVTLVSLHFIGPSIPQAIEKFAPAAAYLQDDYIVKFRPSEIGIDHSAYTIIKQILYLRLRSPEAVGAALHSVEYPYAIVVVLATISAFWFRLRHLPVVNQFIAYLAMSVLLPFVSNAYTLIHVHLAFAVFLLFLVREVATGHSSIRPWLLASFLLTFAILFTPQSYLIPGSMASIDGQIKALALFALIALAMLAPLRSARFGETE